MVLQQGKVSIQYEVQAKIISDTGPSIISGRDTLRCTVNCFVAW